MIPTPVRTPVRTRVMNLLEARDHVARNREDGVFCPCCGSYCKVYSRKLYGKIAYFLWWLVKAYENDPRWYHIDEALAELTLLGARGDYHKLHYWGLIEAKKDVDPEEKDPGYWRPTQVGIDFVYCRLRLPEIALVYMNKVIGWSEKMVDMAEALGKKWNYAELMGRSV